MCECSEGIGRERFELSRQKGSSGRSDYRSGEDIAGQMLDVSTLVGPRLGV